MEILEIILFFSFTLLCRLKFISAEGHMLSSATECEIQGALPTMKKIVQEEKSITKFCQEHLSSVQSQRFKKPFNCAELFYSGHRKSGVYMVSSNLSTITAEFQVYCDMETDGGGWTVFQRRGEFTESHNNFTRSWTDYSKGFGNLFEEFWLGNELIHILSSQGDMTLRVDLEDFSGNTRYAKYEIFSIAGSNETYQLKVQKFSGDAGDSFSGHNGYTFVTFDKNDVNNCAKNYKGGWWYSKCHSSNLNGRYLKGNHESYADGVNWSGWLGQHYSLKYADMKIRPSTF